MTRPGPKFQRTAWHPLYITLLRHVLPRRSFTIRSEVPLSQEPLRIDFVVTRRHELPPLPPPDAPLRSARLFYEAPVTVGELKGPKDVLHSVDLHWLLVYVEQLCALEALHEPEQVQMMVVAGRLSDEFRAQAERYRAQLVEVEPGLHRGTVYDRRLYVVETEVVGDPLLRFFSKAALRRPDALWDTLLTPEERGILVHLHGAVEQFKRKPQLRLRFTDYQELVMNLDEAIDGLLRKLPVEQRLKGLPPEERLKGLPPEQRVQGLSIAERLKGLPPEQRVQGLSAEERLEGLSAEERLKGLSAEERLRLLALLSS
jgi:hypothetical protein